MAIPRTTNEIVELIRVRGLADLADRAEEIFDSYRKECFGLAAGACPVKGGLVGGEGGTPICTVRQELDNWKKKYREAMLMEREVEILDEKAEYWKKKCQESERELTALRRLPPSRQGETGETMEGVKVGRKKIKCARCGEESDDPYIYHLLVTNECVCSSCLDDEKDGKRKALVGYKGDVWLSLSPMTLYIPLARPTLRGWLWPWSSYRRTRRAMKKRKRVKR